MRIGRRLMTRLHGLAMIAMLVVASLGVPGIAIAQTVRISALSDIDFNPITSTAGDIPRAQTVCAYSTVLLGRYSVTASGSGAGGAFTLANGGATMAYDVQWNQNAGATSGTPLIAGTPLTGQASGATTPGCLIGILSAGSLIVTLRSAELQTAMAGNYSGTLTLLLSAN